MTDAAPTPIRIIETAADRYCSTGGVPVWPVRNARERAALARMVSLFGGRIEPVGACEEAILSGPEVVGGLGVEAQEEARLYAHLTRRRHVALERIEDLDGMAPPAVVVTTYRHVTETLLDRLYDPDRPGAAPGLIFSYDDADLRLQVLARSAALQCSPGAPPLRRIDINPAVDFGMAGSPDYLFLGGAAEPDELREALACGAGLLTLHTHSDGIDAYLRDDLVLCPLEPHDRSAPAEPQPSCLQSGICHRCSRPMADVLGSETLLSPDTVAAQVFIYCVCWGLYPPQGVHSAAYSLSRRFIESFTVGALLTSWEINIQRLPATAQLFHDVACGVPLGDALARHLSSEEARASHHRLCLIGDPALRLAPADLADPLHALRSATRPEPPSARAMAALALLRLIVHRLDRDGDDAARLVATGTRYEAMLASGERDESGLADRFRREAVQFLVRHDTMLSKCWAALVDEIATEPDMTPCPVCSRRTVTRISRLRVPGAAARRETMCPNCGSIEDAPNDRPAAMTVRPDGLVRLHGSLPGSDWHARLTIERFFTRETSGWDWPRAPGGEPAPSFQVPEPLPTVPFRLSVIMVDGAGEFTVLGCLYRGPPGVGD